MMLKDKVAVIYGAGGAIGGAVARAFAREGARVFLTRRTLAAVQGLAQEITAEGGAAGAAGVATRAPTDRSGQSIGFLGAAEVDPCGVVTVFGPQFRRGACVIDVGA